MLMLLVSAFVFAIASSPALHVRDIHRDPGSKATILGAFVPQIYTANVSGNSKEPIAATVYIYDEDDDLVHMEWEWGDGTPNGTIDVTGTAGLPEVTLYHVWNASAPGVSEVWVEFIMNITATDIDNNAATVSVSVWIFVPYNNYPTVAISSPISSVDPGAPVEIIANATDMEGDPLTWTFVFNDTDAEVDYDAWVFYTGWSEPNATVWHNITATFAQPGNYTVKMFVSDALPGAQVGIHNNSVRSSTIRVTLNRLPYTTGVFTTVPTTLEINSTIGEINVTFSIEVLDQDGDTLNVTWDFGDGSPPAYNDTTGGKDSFKVSQWRVYNETGQVNISVVVTDGRPGHEVLVSGQFNITTSNLPPVARIGFRYASGNFALPNETIQFTFTVSDPEKDQIQVIIDFGDNSTVEYYNLTAYVGANATLVFNHSYSMTGSYVILISYTDNIQGFGEHHLNYNLTVDVSVPTIVPKKVWSTWDYTSLAIFAMVPVLIIVNLVRLQRKRKAVENKGMSLEEWKIHQSEIKKSQIEKSRSKKVKKKGG